MITTDEGLISGIRYIPLGNGKRCEVKVNVDGRVTSWLEIHTRVTKNYKEFTSPSIGDQVFIHNPNGSNNENAYVVMGVSYESVCLPNTIHENMVAFWVKDGTEYHHNFKTKQITFYTPSSITLKAPKIILDAEVEITKNLKVAGSIFDKKGDLTNHPHPVVNHNLAKPRP